MAILKNNIEDDATENQDSGDEELDTIEVQPVPEAEDDDEDDDPEPGLASKPSRKEKRAARAASHREVTERAERLERELQETRMAQARMQGLIEANLRTQQAPSGPDPRESRVKEVMRRQSEFYENYTANAANMTAEQRREASERAQELEIEKSNALFELNAARAGYGRQQDPRMIQQQVVKAQLDARYPDIAADPRAAHVGMLIFQQMVAEGKADSWDTADLAAEETRKRLGMKGSGKAPKPTRETQARFVGAPSGPRGGGGGAAPSGPIRITKKQAEMAENAYPELAKKDPGKAHQKWWNDVGKKYASK